MMLMAMIMIWRWYVDYDDGYEVDDNSYDEDDSDDDDDDDENDDYDDADVAGEVMGEGRGGRGEDRCPRGELS